MGLELKGLHPKGGGTEAGLGDAEEGDVTGNAEDVMMTEIAFTPATDTRTETEMGALPTKD